MFRTQLQLFDTTSMEAEKSFETTSKEADKIFETRSMEAEKLFESRRMETDKLFDNLLVLLRQNLQSNTQLFLHEFHGFLIDNCLEIFKFHVLCAFELLHLNLKLCYLLEGGFFIKCSL